MEWNGMSFFEAGLKRFRCEIEKRKYSGKE